MLEIKIIVIMATQVGNKALCHLFKEMNKTAEMGTGSQMEINTAQTDMKTAQTNYITALYDAIIAKVDFMKATGKL